jgi:predicted lipid-binding transport protein (Tim44 family)
VPLSEHEQRLLDQIERQLYAEDPKFASAVRSHDVKSHLMRRVKRFAALLVAGLLTLLAGVVVHNVFVGVAGFLVMLAAGLVIARSLQRLGRGDNPPPMPKAKTKKPPKEGSFRDRAEERFRRRFDDPDS